MESVFYDLKMRNYENKKETNNKKPRGMYATKKHVEKIRKEIIETMKKEFEEIQKKQDESWNKRFDEIRKSLFEKTQACMESEDFCKNLSDLQKKPPFKVKKGNWIYLRSRNGNISIVYATSNGNNGSFYGYGYTFSISKWQNLKPGDMETWVVDNAKRNATEQEVVDMIQEQINKRGYECGVKVKCLFPLKINMNLKKINSKIIGNFFLEDLMKGEVIINESPLNVKLMTDGEWAEIVEEKKSVVPDKCDWWEREDEKYGLGLDGGIMRDESSSHFQYTYHTEERAEQMKAFQDLVRLADETNRRDGFDVNYTGVVVYKNANDRICFMENCAFTSFLKFKTRYRAEEFVNIHMNKIRIVMKGGLL